MGRPHRHKHAHSANNDALRAIANTSVKRRTDKGTVKEKCRVQGDAVELLVITARQQQGLKLHIEH